ncbi:S1C family serine protease, partial [Rubripirellula sp.]|nr:S1C family serine protease [Rubripirellula sp.]
MTKTIFPPNLSIHLFTIGTMVLLVNTMVARKCLAQEQGEQNQQAVAAPSNQAASTGEAASPETTVSEVTIHARALSQAFRRAARIATPSVVTILSYGQNIAPEQGESSDESDQSEDGANDRQLSGLGSGVIVSSDGMVITNNHVIRGAKRVVIQLADETEIEATEVRGDADSDVATLRITRDEPFDFAPLGDSNTMEIGDWVLAIGSPFRLEATV